MSGVLQGLFAPGEVTGTSGDDRLYGGKGADRIDGREGTDTFVAAGSFAETLIERDGNATIVGAGPYRDRLVNVEFIQFADVLVRLDDPVLQQVTQHASSAGADLLIGNDLGYVLAGQGGDDTFIGNGGDDTLYGGKGNDTAVYRGNRADYVITYDNVARQVVVSDQLSGRDGTDRLHSIENLRFADGDVAVQPFPDPPAPAPGGAGMIDVLLYGGMPGDEVGSFVVFVGATSTALAVISIDLVGLPPWPLDPCCAML